MNIILNLYRFIFCRPFFYVFNYHVFKLSLRGIGIFNSEGNDVTGERFFLHWLQKNNISIRTVFDVGANAGGYTMDVLHSFPKTKVFAFEPNPQTVSLFYKNIKNKNVLLENTALGQKKKEVLLWDFADDAMLKHTQPTATLASVHKEVVTKLHNQKAKSYKVKMTTVDDYVEMKNIKEIDILKIDTEGNELEVVKGAKKIFKSGNVKILQFEFNEMNAYSRSFLKDFYDLLPGYTFYRLMPYGLYPMGEYRPSTWELFAFQNIVALRTDVAKYV